MSDNWKMGPQKRDLVTEDEFSARMGDVSAETVFMTTLCMLLNSRGGDYTFTRKDLEAYKASYGQYAQLGISVTGDEVTVFVLQEPVAQA